ncbi:hypothetical protein ACHHYP_13886 [Achlya hypogyna]|uniref:Secreted protein n=1 Tax=Achlya hypogyna TaxID=1202772 RepID=A0A0A7CPC4_ACHHY|nr:secreted protein [Achlya hypogyna]OQR84107.1 hypothetical protein ACHHYP_13886 [Achlya hypogyna]
MRTSLCTLAIVAAALDVAAATQNVSHHDEVGMVVRDQFPTSQWGIKRARVHYPAGTIDIYDAWLTVWGGVVNTRCTNCGGGKAWQVMASNAGNGNDMLRNVQDNQCLDAYTVAGDTTPRVHGYACDPNNSNQQWYYGAKYYSWSRIMHRHYSSYCLCVGIGGDAYMGSCNEDNAIFSFIG